jgi:membrane-associated protease RseP (regulator of RpoE activity)
MLRLALASLLLSIATLAGAMEDTLRRRADLGASIAPPEGSTPAHIVRFRADSVLEKAGLVAGDQIVELNGRALPDDITFGAAVRALRGGDSVRLVARRGEKLIRIEIVVPEMPRERIEGLDVRYGVATSGKGYLVRTYTTRPSGVPGKLPVVVFIRGCRAVPSKTPSARATAGGRCWKR